MERMKYKELGDNARTVIEKRISARDENGTPLETWPDVVRRVVQKVARAEKQKDRAKWTKEFTDLLLHRLFLPNSPALQNFGKNNGCGSACFVIPIDDSRESIFDALKNAVNVQAFGGGTGFDFSPLRPEGSIIKSTGGKASGPISFMKIFDLTIGDIIKQGGTRHGANMGILRVDHPDIEKFIFCKKEEGTLKNFNISVALTDNFMQAVKDGADYELKWNGNIYGSLPARKVWGWIVGGSWKNGEPGVVFIDQINKNNPFIDVIGPIAATNPCGEQPLLPYESCNLGSINLAAVVKGNWVNGKAEIDWDLLEKIIKTSARFLDDVIDVNTYPVPEIEAQTKLTRKIGMGIMGYADMLIKLHVRYGSQESIELAKRIMQFVYDKTNEVSIAIGVEKGLAPVFEQNPSYKFSVPPRRNAQLTTIAPTGTLSTLAECSSGCEPNFMLTFFKNCLDGEVLEIKVPVFQEWVDAHGPGNIPDFFVTAAEVTPEEHIRVQAAFQNNGIDAAVSKTINLPNGADTGSISKALMLAWELGAKGCTVYRDGSRDEQPLHDGKGKKRSTAASLERGEIKERKGITVGTTFPFQTACGQIFCEPKFDEDGPFELFVSTSNRGGCAANTKALSMAVSWCLRLGADPDDMARKLQEITCSACARAVSGGNEKNLSVMSCPAGMGKALGMVMQKSVFDNGVAMARSMSNEDIAKALAPIVTKRSTGQSRMNYGDPQSVPCPECGAPLDHASGCVNCVSCGYSKC